MRGIHNSLYLVWRICSLKFAPRSQVERPPLKLGCGYKVLTDSTRADWYIAQQGYLKTTQLFRAFYINTELGCHRFGRKIELTSKEKDVVTIKPSTRTKAERLASIPAALHDVSVMYQPVRGKAIS